MAAVPEFAWGGKQGVQGGEIRGTEGEIRGTRGGNKGHKGLNFGPQTKSPNQVPTISPFGGPTMVLIDKNRGGK